jgi:hypothetical protein
MHTTANFHDVNKCTYLRVKKPDLIILTGFQIHTCTVVPAKTQNNQIHVTKPILPPYGDALLSGPTIYFWETEN